MPVVTKYYKYCTSKFWRIWFGKNWVWKIRCVQFNVSKIYDTLTFWVQICPWGATSGSWKFIVSINFLLFTLPSIILNTISSTFRQRRNELILFYYWFHRLEYSSSTTFPATHLGAEQPRAHASDSPRAGLILKRLGEACHEILEASLSGVVCDCSSTTQKVLHLLLWFGAWPSEEDLDSWHSCRLCLYSALKPENGSSTFLHFCRLRFILIRLV